MNCHFCGTEGVLAACELHEAPPDVKGKAGLKLVTCDFHRHHCSFFMCAKCWNGGKHLCKNKHPDWLLRLAQFDLSSKKEILYEKWMFRYAIGDDWFPSVCTIKDTKKPFCAVCLMVSKSGKVGAPCDTPKCDGILKGAGCPACLPIDLPDNDGFLQDCSKEQKEERQKEDESDKDTSKELVEKRPPDDLHEFFKLDLRYVDKSDYQFVVGKKAPSGKCINFLVHPNPPQWEDDYEPSEVAYTDVSDWVAYRGTNLKLLGNASVWVLLPDAKFLGGPVRSRNHVPPDEEREARTRDKSKRQRLEVGKAVDIYGGAVAYHTPSCTVFRLRDKDLDFLEVPSNDQYVQETGLLIGLPPRGGRGSGGAIGRANDLGSSGVKHVLVKTDLKAPDVTWSRYSKLQTILTDKKTPSGKVDGIVDFGLGDGTKCLALRLLPWSTLALFIEVPDGKKHVPGARAVELWRGWQNEKARYERAVAAFRLTKLSTAVDDGGKPESLSESNVVGYAHSSRFAELEKSLQTLAEAWEHLLAVKEKKVAAIESQVRAAALAILRCLRHEADVSLGTAELAEQALVEAGKFPLQAARDAVEDVKKRLVLAHDLAQRSLEVNPKFTGAEGDDLVEIQELLDLKGDPKALGGQALVDWWGDLFWLPEDGGSDLEQPEVEEAPNIPRELVGKETESGRPDAYPDSPPVTDDYWNWNGRPLTIVGDVERTWQLLTQKRLECRNYKDSGLHLMKPHDKSRGERPQDTFFDSVSATEVALGLTNKLAGSRFKVLPPDFNAKRPNPFYEWSHLIGDGEGGGIHRSNIVSSTRANNTEMLIIETVLQQWRPAIEKAGLELVLRVQVSTFGRVPDLERDYSFHKEVRYIHYQTHVGDWMRYTVCLRKTDAFEKPKKEPSPPPDYPTMAVALDHILDCLRPRISKTQARVMDFQARYLLARALKTRYGIELKDADGLEVLPLGNGGGKGALRAKPYAKTVALTTTNGKKLKIVQNRGDGDCLFLSADDALQLLPKNERDAAYQRAGFDPNNPPDAKALRERGVLHLARILGYAVNDGFIGSMDAYGPPNDPCAGHTAIIDFLTTYREDYARAWGGYETWEQYLGLMQSEGWWGDMIMCIALSHLLGVQIDVHQGHGTIQPILANELQPPPVLRLRNEAGVHFEALEEVDDTIEID
jgi:hypothetical protein